MREKEIIKNSTRIYCTITEKFDENICAKHWNWQKNNPDGYNKG